MKVEKNLPIPKENRGRKAKYPWDKLKVGDSFFIEGKSKKYNVYSCVASYNRTKAPAPISITIREEGEGVRVWRIK